MQRIEYMKVDGGCPKFVVCEIDSSGSERFLERDCRGVDLLPFVPSDDERSVAHRILREASQNNGVLTLHHVQGQLRIDWFR